MTGTGCTGESRTTRTPAATAVPPPVPGCRAAGRVVQGGARHLPAQPQLVQQLPFPYGELGADAAPARPVPQEREGGRVGLVPGDRAGRLAAEVVAGVLAGKPAGPHRAEHEGFGRGGQPARVHIDGQLLAHTAQFALPGPHREPGQQAERGDHEDAVDLEEAVLAERRGAVPDRVHAHREEETGQGDQDAADVVAVGGVGGDAEADAGEDREQGVREGGHDDAHEEGRRGDGGETAVAGELVGAEGRAQVEDVLGEREAGGGDPGDHHPVDDPGEVPSAEQEDEEYGGGFRGLLDDRGYDGGAQGVRAGRVRGGRRYPSRREAVGDDGYEGRGAGAPREGEEQVAPGAGVDPVQPAEGGDEEGYGQYGEPETHQEPFRTGLLADQRQDDEPGEGEEGDQRDVPDPVPLPPASARRVGGAAGVWGRGKNVATASTLTR